MANLKYPLNKLEAHTKRALHNIKNAAKFAYKTNNNKKWIIFRIKLKKTVEIKEDLKLIDDPNFLCLGN